MERLTLEEALASLTDIRRSINRVRNPADTPGTFRARLAILLSAGGAAGSLFLTESFTGAVTRGVLRSQTDLEYRISGLTTIGIGIFLAVCTLFCILAIYARENRERTATFVDKYFPQLSLLAFSSDLFVKFTALATVIMTLHPELVAPLLLIYVADYLFQGRVFTLPFRTSVTTGVAVIGLATVQFCLHEASLLLALAIFTALAALSALRTCRDLRIAGESTQAGAH